MAESPFIQQFKKEKNICLGPKIQMMSLESSLAISKQTLLYVYSILRLYFVARWLPAAPGPHSPRFIISRKQCVPLSRKFQ